MKEIQLEKNTTYFTVALVIQKILSFIYFWIISSNISPSILGRYIFALSYTAVFGIFIELGMTPVLIRESSKSKENTNDLLRNIIGIKLLLSVFVIIILLFIINVINVSDKPMEVKYLVYLSSIIMLLDSFTVSFWGIFRSFQNMFYESIGTIFVQIIIFCAGYIALKFSGNIVYIMLALVLASIFNFAFSAAILRIKLKISLAPAWNINTIKTILKLIPAFAASGIFAKIYNSADSVLLGFFSTEVALGLYAIPAKVITSLSQVIPSAFAAALFPVFSKHYSESKEQLKKTFLNAFKYLIVISLPITGGLIVLVPTLLHVIWPAYQGVLTTFIVMSFSIPFIFLAFATGYLLNACNRQRNNMINRGVMAILTIILNIILIPKMSYLGTGIVFVFVNILVFIMDFYYVAKIIPLQTHDIRNILTKSLIASIIMTGMAYTLIQYIHFIFIILISAIVYFGILFITKTIDISEIKKIIKL